MIEGILFSFFSLGRSGYSELSVAHMVKFLAVEFAHLGLNPRLSIGACMFFIYSMILSTLFFQW